MSLGIPESAVVVTDFFEQEGITTLTQRITYDSAAARDGVLRSPMEGGVRISYDRLEELLTGRMSETREYQQGVPVFQNFINCDF